MTIEPSACAADSIWAWGRPHFGAPTRSPWRPSDDGGCSFGRFRLLPAARILLRDEVVVPLGSRAFDLLHALLLSRGAVVSTPEIVRRVWPSTTVDDCNVRFQVASLRKALGEDRDLIKTVAGRGYILAEETRAAAPPEPPAAPEPAEDVAQDLAALCGLLRSVLDELRRMSPRGESDPAGRRAAQDRTFAHPV